MLIGPAKSLLICAPTPLGPATTPCPTKAAAAAFCCLAKSSPSFLTLANPSTTPDNLSDRAARPAEAKVPTASLNLPKTSAPIPPPKVSVYYLSSYLKILQKEPNCQLKTFLQ